jgi:hypothetical protein
MKKESKTVLELLKEKTASQEFTLPVSGLTVVMQFFSAKKNRVCAEISKKGDSIDEELFQAAMIAETCTFNNEKLTAEDILQYMNGTDLMFMQGKLMGSDLAEKK